MGILNYLTKTAAPWRAPKNPRGSLFSWVYSDDNVTTENALELSDILTCVRVLAESVACLPLCLYKYTENGGEKDYGSRLFELIRWQPNPDQTSYELRLWMMTDALLRGNGCAQIIRNATGEVLELHPLYSSKLTYELTPEGELVYCYPDPDNEGEKVYMQRDEVLIIKTFATGELLSPSLISLGSNLFEGAKGAEEYTREFFRNGSVLSGFIEYPDEMDEETFQRLKRDWSDSYTGSGNRHKTPI